MTVDATRWRLAFARRLLQRARALTADASPFAPSEAVVAAQDAVELALWALADANRYLSPKKPKPQVSFYDLLGCVPSAAPHSKALDQLNTLRVQAKHYGAGIDRAEAMRQIERAARAISEISISEPPHVDVARAYLASALSNRLVASALECAESMIDGDENRVEFATQLAYARYFILQHARDALRVERRSPRIRIHGYQGEERALARAIDELSSEMRDSLSKIEDRLAEFVLLADRGDAILLSRLLPTIWWNGGGKSHHVTFRPGAEQELTADRRAALLMALARAAEQAEALEVTASSVETGYGISPRLEVLAEADAMYEFEAGDERVVAHLRPGDYVRRAWVTWKPTDEWSWIRVYGVDCTVPLGTIAGDADGTK